MNVKFFAPALVAASLGILAHAPVFAADDAFVITIKDHAFSPATLEVPAGAKIKLVVKNLDATPEEFESADLRREKIIAGGKEVVINLGPLKAGTYKYEGEFHPKTAQGTLVAK